MQDNVYYKKGLQKEVSDTHSWRNVENSMAFMIKFINANHSILDVGCGPGTITNDKEKKVPNGKVYGKQSKNTLDTSSIKLVPQPHFHSKIIPLILYLLTRFCSTCKTM